MLRRIQMIAVSLFITVSITACAPPTESIETERATEASMEVEVTESNVSLEKDDSVDQPDPHANSDLTFDWHYYESLDELIEDASHVHVLTDFSFTETVERNSGYGVAINYDYYSATRLIADGDSVEELPYTFRVIAGDDSTWMRELIAEDFDYYIAFMNGDEEVGTPLSPWQGLYGYDGKEVVQDPNDQFILELNRLSGVGEILQKHPDG